MHIDVPGIRVERSSDGYAFLFEERFGFVYLLSDTGYFLAKMLIDGDPSENDLVEALKERFLISPEHNIVEDVQTFLNALREYSLLP